MSVLLDRATGQNVIMASTEGGMDIEEVAEPHSPRRSTKRMDRPRWWACRPFQARKIAFNLGLEGDAQKEMVKFMPGPVQAPTYETDSAMFEINPVLKTSDNKILAVDAKVNLDENALFRHKDFAGPARHQRGRPPGSGSQQVEPELREARRQRGLHGERRRPGHGHHGHHQAFGRRAGQLPRRRAVAPTPRRWKRASASS